MMKKATRRVLERMSNIYKILQETFRGLRVVKAFTMEPYERRRFNRATKDYCDRSTRMVTIDALASPLVELMGVGAVSVAILAGAYLVLNHTTHIFGLRMSNSPIEPETLLQALCSAGRHGRPRAQALQRLYQAAVVGGGSRSRLYLHG